MIHGMEVSDEYGGLTLTCDEPTFARFCDVFRNEAGVADSSSVGTGERDMKFIG